MLAERALNNLLPAVRTTCLLVHGEPDTPVPVDNPKATVQLMAGPVQLKLVPGGYYMRSAALMAKQMPDGTAWSRMHLWRVTGLARANDRKRGVGFVPAILAHLIEPINHNGQRQPQVTHLAMLVRMFFFREDA
jgi:hypothetical protein